MKRDLSILLALLLALTGTSARAMGPHGEIETAAELAPLPSYCKGTLVTRYTIPDPRPLKDYVAIYGRSFNDTHHYCWALNQENHLDKLSGSGGGALYGPIMNNIKYVLDQAQDSFSLLPEIYMTKARVLFKFNNNAEAIEALLKLIQIRPAFAPAYAQLGDYYQRKNDRANATKWFEQGLIQTSKRNAEYFIWKLKKLDSNYTPPADVLEAMKKPEEQESAATNASGIAGDDTSASAPAASSAAESSPPDTAPVQNDTERPNPYCRFCP